MIHEGFGIQAQRSNPLKWIMLKWIIMIRGAGLRLRFEVHSFVTHSKSVRRNPLPLRSRLVLPWVSFQYFTLPFVPRKYLCFQRRSTLITQRSLVEVRLWMGAAPDLPGTQKLVGPRSDGLNSSRANADLAPPRKMRGRMVQHSLVPRAVCVLLLRFRRSFRDLRVICRPVCG